MGGWKDSGVGVVDSFAAAAARFLKDGWSYLSDSGPRAEVWDLKGGEGFGGMSGGMVLLVFFVEGDVWE